MKADPQLILSLATCAAWVVGGVLAAATILGVVAIWKAGEKAIVPVGELIVRGDGLRMLTVILILGATSVLVLLGHTTGEAGITIFSGIAGYVLGGTSKKPPEAVANK